MRAIGITLALALAVGTLPSVAAAQELDPALRPDLNGVWEVQDRGVLRQPGPARVRITQVGPSVVAEFTIGAECFDGKKRPDYFIAELVVLAPGQWTLSSPAMWACSGSPDLVKKCGDRIPSSYKTTFANATVTRDRIEGQRATQGVLDCALDPSSNGRADFVLKRLPPCAEEERKLKEREKDLRDLLNTILSARAVFRRTMDAARARYGGLYNGASIANLVGPYAFLSAVQWESTIELTEDFFDRMPATVAADDWNIALAMASAMLVDPANPLPQAKEMLDRMHQIERMAPEAARALAAYRNARQELDRCRQAAQRK